MRLVDADKQLEFVDRVIPKDKIAQEVALSVDSVRDWIIKDAPTIDAIPVGWLREKLVNHPELPYCVTDGIQAVLDLWQNEQEARA